MALTELDTRLALLAQTPQIDFNQLANNSLALYDNMKQRGQQGILSRLLSQNTGADGKIDYNKALQTIQANPNQAYQPTMVNTLSGLIQQNEAARLKAQQDAEQQKISNAEAQSKTRKTESETNLSQLNASAPIYDLLSKGATKAALNYAGTMKNRGLFSDEDYSGLVQQIQENQNNPQGLIDYGSAMFRSMLDPKFNIADANTIANNKTSRENNQETVGVQKEKIAQDQKQFEQNIKLDKQKQWFEQNKPVAFGVDINGRKYRSLANGKNVYEKDESGNYIIEQPKGSGQMSPTTQKELFETDDAVNSGQAVITGLQDAIGLNDKSYSGLGALGRAQGAGLFSDSEEAKNTVLIDNIITGNALNALKATFGAAPTEGERKILVELQGSVNLPSDQRKAIWERAQGAAKRRLEYNQQKADALRNGSYTKTSYKPYSDVPNQTNQNSNSSNNAVSKASSKWGI